MDSGTLKYLDELGIASPLEQRELFEYIKLAQAGDIAALNTVITHNLKLIRYVIRTCFKNIPDDSIGDLISEGYIGLRRAVLKFTPYLDIKFGSYAVIWIKQAMMLHIKNLNFIRTPRGMTQHKVRVHKDDSINDLAGQSQMTDEIDTENNVDRIRLLELVDKEIVSLNIPARDIEILKLKFEDNTHEALAARFSISQARVGQIIKRIIRLLRKSKTLKPFLP